MHLWIVCQLLVSLCSMVYWSDVLLLLISNLCLGIFHFWLCIYYLLQKTLSSLELPGVVSVAAQSTNASLVASSSQVNQGRSDVSSYDSNTGSQSLRRQKNKSNDPTKDLSIQVLEKFSLVTKFARETTSQLFGENSGDPFLSNEWKRPSHSQSLPDLQSQPSTNDLEEVPCEVPVPADPMEVFFFPSTLVLFSFFLRYSNQNYYYSHHQIVPCVQIRILLLSYMQTSISCTISVTS